MKMIAFNIIIFVRSISLYNYNTYAFVCYFSIRILFLCLFLFFLYVDGLDIDAISEFLFMPFCRHRLHIFNAF